LIKYVYIVNDKTRPKIIDITWRLLIKKAPPNLLKSIMKTKIKINNTTNGAAFVPINFIFFE
jgi:hypothetical protein